MIVVETQGENGIELVEISATDYFGQEMNNFAFWLSVYLPGLVTAFLVQYIFGRYVFFTADKQTRWLRYRYFYALYDCAPVHSAKVPPPPPAPVSPMSHGSMCACACETDTDTLQFFNCTLGLGMMLVRTITWFFMGILFIGRLDLCLLPLQKKLDSPWNCYVALMLQDHQCACAIFNVRRQRRRQHHHP